MNSTVTQIIFNPITRSPLSYNVKYNYYVISCILYSHQCYSFYSHVQELLFIIIIKTEDIGGHYIHTCKQIIMKKLFMGWT